MNCKIWVRTLSTGIGNIKMQTYIRNYLHCTQVATECNQALDVGGTVIIKVEHGVVDIESNTS